MGIEEQVNEELTKARKARNRDEVDALAMIKTRLAERRTSPGFVGPITDAVAVEIIGGYIKSLKKALPEFEAAGAGTGPLVDKYLFEIAFLSRYLPQTLDEDATRALVRQAKVEQGLAGPSQIGRLMGAVMKTHKDQVDSALVRRIAEEELAG